MIVLLNKPYNVLCQFTDSEGRATLAELVKLPDIYPAGRLDYDSEGLLLLTDDGKLVRTATEPRHAWAKTYWVQVEGEPMDDQLDQLRRGVRLNDGPTKPAQVESIAEPAQLWPRDPPVRFRAAIPTTWLRMTIREGRNRQVRRMTALVGLPTLRLIRIAIGPYQLQDLAPGDLRVVDSARVAKPLAQRALDHRSRPALRSARAPRRPLR